MIVTDNEGFPFDYKKSACNFRNIPTETPQELKPRPEDIVIASSLLENRPESKMAAEYELRLLLSGYAGLYVTDNNGRTHEQVKYTKDYAVFRYSNPSDPHSVELIKYRFPYNANGINHCRKLLSGDSCAPTINAEYI